MSTIPRIRPAGDSSVIIEFGDQIDLAVNRRVHSLAVVLDADGLPGVIEVLPTYCGLSVYYDPLVLSFDSVARWLHDHAARVTDSLPQRRRVIEVPIRYGGEFGPDLDAVAAYHDLSPADVIDIHSQRDYDVFMIGFTPGFPYLGELSERIATPRLDTPRQHVLAGSVGIAARQTGIYPIESPGGWRIIGRTPLKLFDPDREPPFLIDSGDVVRFVVSR